VAYFIPPHAGCSDNGRFGGAECHRVVIGSSDHGSQSPSGAGWITFDPTNRGIGGFNLIPVAVGRDIRQIMPVVGSFVGMSDAFQGMSVEVQVSS
jgi:hypothetical protein